MREKVQLKRQLEEAYKKDSEKGGGATDLEHGS